jgi:ADP-ribose pyrophosphatase YjhB (NUDIX family)
MASGTATMLPIDAKRQRVLLGVRSKNAWVYPGKLSLAGGFMEARFTEEQNTDLMSQARQAVLNLLGWKLVADEFSEGENLEECAVRELGEEMLINVAIDQLKMFSVRSNARTDTRAHVINACYYFEMTDEQIEAATAGDDLEELVWHDMADFDIEIPYAALEAKYDMAFNHFEVMLQGIAAWRKEQRFKILEAQVASMENVRGWQYFPIMMPLTAKGDGPATIGHDATQIKFEVWDQALETYGSFEFLPDAINEAMRLNRKAMLDD